MHSRTITTNNEYDKIVLFDISKITFPIAKKLQ